MLSGNSRIVASKDQVSCELADEVAILSLRNHTYYALNPVGARVWQLLQQQMTLGALLDTLLSEYDVDAKHLERDLDDLLITLEQQGLVEISA